MKRGNKGVAEALALMGRIAVSMVVCVVAGVLAGIGLDRWLGTSPWLLVLLSLGGVFSALRMLYVMATKK